MKIHELFDDALDEISKRIYEGDYLKRKITELSENALEALGYTEQDEVPDDVIDNIETWALVVLKTAKDVAPMLMRLSEKEAAKNVL